MQAEARDLILNVNDADSARYLVTRILKHAGFEVVEARSGEEALRMARERHPRLVVLDVRLPDMDGHQVCRALRSDPAMGSITILQTSATFVSSDSKVEGLESGADAYLTQPFESVELVALVNALLRSKRHEAESRQRAAALMEADARKDEFLAMLGHELRNPLSAILTATTLLEQTTTLDQHQTGLTSTIQRQAKNLAALVDDLLDVSRITQRKIQLRKQRVELQSVLKSAIDAMRTSFFDKRRHELRVDVPEQPIHLDADPTRLEQILTNVLGNAAKYTEAGGCIEVACQATRGSRGPMVRIEVRDNGIGIARENLASVFDLFFQVDTASLARTSGGLGIGLTMVQRLVELHEGTVTIDSDGIGRGTTVTLELPLAGHGVVEAHSTEQAAGATKQNMRVLVVDDNVDSCELVKLWLELSGHSIETAHEGETALRLALSEPFDAAILDIGLPLLDGYQVAQRLSERLKERKPYLIALSGYGRQEDRERAVQAGFDLHLTKPVDPSTLERVLARSLDPAVGSRVP